MGTQIDSQGSLHSLGQFLALWGLVGAIALFLVNLFMAMAIGSDAKGRLDRKLPVAFFGPGLWFLATCLGSFLAVALYWVMHYSTLRHPQEFPGRP